MVSRDFLVLVMRAISGLRTSPAVSVNAGDVHKALQARGVVCRPSDLMEAIYYLRDQRCFQVRDAETFGIPSSLTTIALYDFDDARMRRWAS